MPLLDILAHTIKFLTNNCMKTLQLRVPDIQVSDVFFVLTIPAIWSDQAKRFMRGAAIKVIITSMYVCMYVCIPNLILIILCELITNVEHKACKLHNVSTSFYSYADVILKQLSGK